MNDKKKKWAGIENFDEPTKGESLVDYYKRNLASVENNYLNILTLFVKIDAMVENRMLHISSPLDDLTDANLVQQCNQLYKEIYGNLSEFNESSAEGEHNIITDMLYGKPPLFARIAKNNT